MRFTVEFAEKTWISIKLIMSTLLETKLELILTENAGTETLNGSAVPLPGATSPQLTMPLLTSSTLIVRDLPKQPSDRGDISMARTGPSSVPVEFAGNA